jgi:hypothetical protein
MKTRIITLLLVAGTFINVNAQELLDMIKRDINAERRTIVAEALEVPAEASTDFWNLYNSMETELDAVTDLRAANIKKFADNYENVTDDIANDLANNYFNMVASRNKINKTYYKKAAKIIGKKEAARFIQLLGQIQLLIDIQIAAEVPLIE